ncbi:unnamed protein product [Acanthocheilonema viteae]|uniref:Uncharacterized protein n=1 Tax=Acanthocheilonema viteae TaxID=6277 RepID=A0A498SZI3_ACAVI|nr:unnamed protein product [Acanthocheilonema viteae]
MIATLVLAMNSGRNEMVDEMELNEMINPTFGPPDTGNRTETLGNSSSVFGRFIARGRLFMLDREVHVMEI